MDEDEKKFLKDTLMQDKPILFLGAGFSYGAYNEYGKLPKGNGLRDDLYKDIIAKSDCYSYEQKENIKKLELSSLCNFIKAKKELHEQFNSYIINRFINVKPTYFQNKLICFPWKKIYTVNVDDIIERVYRNARLSCLVQNKKHKENANDAMEIIKLHGCVHEKNEPFIFSKSDYDELISGIFQYRLNDLLVDLEHSSFIFIGAAMNEPDISYYLHKYQSAGYDLGKGKIIFIDPQPNIELELKADEISGRIIKATAEEFFNYVSSLEYDPSKLDRVIDRMEYKGIYRFTKIMNSLETDVYESNLYQGYESNWRDLQDDWMFLSPSYYEIIKIIENKLDSRENIQCIAIHGIRFTGKGCILKLLARYFKKNMYEVLWFNGKELDKSTLLDFIKCSQTDKIVLMIPNAAFYYVIIEKMFKMDIDNKRLLIITTSREYNHVKKEYYLKGNPYISYEAKNIIDKKYANSIHEKLKEKGSIGLIDIDKEKGVNYIYDQKTLVDVFSTINFGGGFKSRIKDDIKEIEGGNCKGEIYFLLSLFNKADLEYYPKELLNGKYKLIFNKDYEKTNVDSEYIFLEYVSNTERGISLKNCLIVDIIWKQCSKNYKAQNIKNILKQIAPHVCEKKNDYWKIIFESIAKEDWLEKVGLSNSIMDIYYSLKSDYKFISYFWLQLGIAEQRKKCYSKAQTHLDMAAQINPNSYQIQHAIARNKLLYAININDQFLSKKLFEEGESQMIELINSEEYYKQKARDFSIHCYIINFMDYMRKNKIKPNKSKIEELIIYVKMMNSDDRYYESLVDEFSKFLIDNNIQGYTTFNIGDDLGKAMLKNSIADNVEDDYIVNTFQ